jgi:hypothetical protein
MHSEQVEAISKTNLSSKAVNCDAVIFLKQKVIIIGAEIG